MTNFSPIANMDAAIEAKIEAALLNGVNISDASADDPEKYAVLMEQVGITPEEQLYMAKRTIYRMAQIEIGKRLVQALNEHCKVPREDIVPCITAYFDALDNGEVSA
ncbi:hypothetical protein ABIA22_000392 [Sinorhizobium fredii]|uniref:hypothetical protein n=1 Tax=Rhizobium fredii TaxID=380 RepID=UPI003512B4CD